MPDLDRRDFLKFVGASAGAAASAGCGDPVSKLIPYVVQPEEITPGIAVDYASTCTECPAACGLHVRTREGRPVKLEGNPEHPVNRGALCARGQASLGRAYHPDRFRGPLKRDASGAAQPVEWKEAIQAVGREIANAGDGVWVLGGETGPTASAWIDRFVSAVGAGGRAVYEPFAPEALREASRRVFGTAAAPVFDLSGADLVLDFGSDFLETGPSPVEHARQLAEARDADDADLRATRLVSIGPRMSMTVSNADDWIAAKPGTEGMVALAVLGVAFENGGGTPEARGALGGLVSRFDAKTVAAKAGVPLAAVERLGKALAKAESPVALPPGAGLTSRRATATAGAVLLLNWAVGAVGRGVHVPAREAGAKRASYRETLALVDAMKTGRVRVLLIHGTNPLYSLPPSAGFAEAIAKVPVVVSLASAPDETTALAHWVLPDHSPFESWGDAEPRPGVRSVQQPTLRPLYDTQALVDTLLALGREAGADLPEKSFRTLVEEAWAGTEWHEARSRGGVFGPMAEAPVTLTEAALRLQVAEPNLEGDGDFALLALPSPLLYDGRGANLPWLQEIPDPVSKVAWQSWAEVSLGTAERLGGLEYGDVIAVETGAGTLELPIIPRGGVRDDVIAINVGQGHTVGLYASRANDGHPGEARGVNVISVLPSLTDESGGRAWLVARAAARSTGRHYRLPFVQDSQNKRGRLLGEAVSLLSLAEGDAHANAQALQFAAFEGGEHGEEHGDGHGDGHHEMLKPFDPTKDSSADSFYRWGMSVDLDRCTGCSACVAACYVENNIPVVGEEDTRRGRHMAWLRIERWVGEGDREGGEELPILPDERGHEGDIRHSPMMCQQCGAAPCEPVCPVIATYHNEDGLNGMIYNRCIGTRYCSNNCPYKVRRYNWFDYALERWPEPLGLMANPDVTVRGQGVMEKCTFCVQRITVARQTAKDAGRPIADGEVTTACAQACPTQAIHFGNLKDEQSTVSHKDENPRNYHALHELNTRPAVTYLAKVTRGPVEG